MKRRVRLFGLLIRTVPAVLAASCGLFTDPQPAGLAIVVQPSSTGQSGVALSQQPVVQLRDEGGSDIEQSGVSVTVGIASGGGALGGTTTVQTNTTGRAVFTNLSISGLVGNRTLEFTASGLTAVTSSAIGVEPGPPSRLAMATQPSSSAQSGMTFGIQPAVQLRDASGNDVSRSGVPVAAAIASGAGVLGGTTVAQTNGNGRAVFADLAITGVVGNRTLEFSSSGLTPANSDAIDLTPGPASQLVIMTQPPSSAQSGMAFSAPPVVQLRDASDNDVSQSGVSVTAEIAGGGGTLDGTTTVETNGAGQAIFTDLSISGLVGGRTLGFSSGTLPPVTSTSVSLTAGVVAQLALTTQPSSEAQNGVPFSTQPVVQLRDASGNDRSDSGVPVTASVATGAGTLGGALTVQTNSSGQAAFTDLSLSGDLGDRTLQFSASNLTAATSNTIGLGAGPPSKLVITTQPSSSVRSGVTLPTQPVVQLRDASDNDVSQSGVSVTAAITTGSGALGGTKTVQTDGSGQALFTNLSISGLVGTNTLGFTSGTLSPATSNGITLTAGFASKLALTTQPSSNAESGVAFATQPIVQLRDASGNDVSQSGVAVTAGIASGGGTLGGTTPVQTNSGGEAIFTNLSITGTSGNRTLGFSSPSMTGVTSNTISVTQPTCTLTTPGDADGDRLPDCVETNTGVFVSVLDTGTDPNDPDSDDDAISDGDEVLGTTGGLDLPLMGASPLHQDILVEYDWFDDALECSAHSHRPTAAALAMVTAAFANAPVSNPDGSTGINFIHDYGQGGVFTGGNLISDADGVLSTGVNGAEFQNHKSANFAANRNGYFHYAILPHRYNTNSSSSGQAELPGDDFIVSLYCFGSNVNVAHTIMHELGHNLNLLHGGLDNTNYKPNYNSVMNYKYQFPGIDNDCTPPGNGVLSYSIGARPLLNENNLNETQGVCGNPPGPGWDWNGDGDAVDVGIAVDINVAGDGSGDGILGTLQDYNDWAFLTLTGIFDADGARLVATEIVSCMNPPPAERR